MAVQIMNSEELQNEIRLTFARACADSLEKSIELVLAAKKEDRAGMVEAVADLHATTCLKLINGISPRS